MRLNRHCGLPRQDRTIQSVVTGTESQRWKSFLPPVFREDRQAAISLAGHRASLPGREPSASSIVRAAAYLSEEAWCVPADRLVDRGRWQRYQYHAARSRTRADGCNYSPRRWRKWLHDAYQSLGRLAGPGVLVGREGPKHRSPPSALHRTLPGLPRAY